MSLFQFRRPGAKRRRVRNEKGSPESKRRRLTRMPHFEPLEQRQLLSVVAGRVWLDTDADGAQGPAELGKNGVTVNLYQYGVDSPVLSQTTGATGVAGQYRFDNVPADEFYRVEVIRPDLFSLTRPDVGNDSTDSDVNPFTGVTKPWFLLPPASQKTVDAGLVENFAKVKVDDGDPNDGDDDVEIESPVFGVERVEFDVYISKSFHAQQVGGYTAVITVDPPNPGITFVGAVQADNPLFPSSTPGGTRDPNVYYAGTSGRTNDGVADDLGRSYVPVFEGAGLFTLQFDVAAGTSGEFDIVIDSPENPLKFTNEVGDNIWNVDVQAGKLKIIVPEPTIHISDVSLREGKDGELTPFAFTVSATGSVSPSNPLVVEAVTVPATAMPGIDYISISTPKQMTFTSTDPQTLFVYVRGDNLPELHETFRVLLRDPANPGTPLDEGVGTILDDDTAQSSIGDRVWWDQDNDGVQDLGEPGLAGIEVNLYDSTEVDPVATTTSTADGYSFVNLIAGQYFVEFVVPQDYRFVAKNNPQAGSALDSDADSTGRTSLFTLGISQQRSDIDVGLRQLAFTMKAETAVMDIPTVATDGHLDVYFEVPSDFQPYMAAYNAAISIVSPPGFEGLVTLKEDATRVDGRIPVFPGSPPDFAPDFSQYTPGSVEGTKLQVGDYLSLGGGSAAVEVKNGYGAFGLDFTVAPGVAGVFEVKIDEKIVTDASGYRLNVNAVSGYIIVGPASVSGRVWEDLEDDARESDGIRQDDESGLGGVVVELYRQPDVGAPALAGTTQTDALGSYEFTDLLPGDYFTAFVRPDNTYRYTPKDQGADDTRDSDADPVTGRTDAFTVGFDEELTLDAGMRQLKFEVIVDTVIVKDTDLGGHVDVYFKVPLELQPYLASYNAVVSIYPGGYTGAGDVPEVSWIALSDQASQANNQVFPGQTPGFSQFSAGLEGAQLQVSDYLPNDQVAAARIDNGEGLFGIDFVILDGTAAEGVGKYDLRIEEVLFSDAGGNPLLNYILRPGKILVNPVSVGDRVWDDVNGDGIQDAGEPGMAGAGVSLYRSGMDPAVDDPVRTTTTNDDGAYLFTELEIGDYFLVFDTPPGYKPTVQDAGDDAEDSDIDADGTTQVLALGPNETDLTLDAGFELLKFTVIVGAPVIVDNPDPTGPDTGSLELYFEVPVGLLEDPYLASYNAALSVTPQAGANGSVEFVEQATRTQTKASLFGDHDPEFSKYGGNPPQTDQLLVGDYFSGGVAEQIIDNAGFFKVEFTIPAGTFGTFDLNIDELILVSPDSTRLTNYTIVSNQIVISPPAPDAEFSIFGDAQGNENDGVQFTIELSGALAAPTSVDVSIIHNQTTDDDFHPSWQSTVTVDFPAGETSVPVTVLLNADLVVEANETFVVQITNPSPGMDIDAAKAQATGTILNDDQATLTIQDVTLPEGGQGVEIVDTPLASVVLGETENDLIIGFREQTGVSLAQNVDVDHVPNGTDVTFGPAAPTGGVVQAGIQVDSWFFHFDPLTPDYVTVQNGAIQFSDDILGVIFSTTNLNDSDTLGNPGTVYPTGIEGFRAIDVTGSDRFTLLSDNRTLLFNSLMAFTNSDQIRLLVKPGAQIVSTTPFVFDVTLSHAVDVPVSVDYTVLGDLIPGNSAEEGVDYVAANLSGTLQFAGQAGEIQRVVVLVNNDLLAEQDETFSVKLSGVDADGRDVVIGDDEAVGTILNDDVLAAAVVRRYVFYGNSRWDDLGGDDGAIATDKRELLPGETASYLNYTSYDRGINGIMIDVMDLPDGVIPMEADFVFRAGGAGAPGVLEPDPTNPASWGLAPQPLNVEIRPGAGSGTDDAGQAYAGADRIVITWADGAIKNQWLQVIVKDGTALGLAQADVFYFGNQVAETLNSSENAVVNTLDEFEIWKAIRASGGAEVGISNRFDINRDKKVNALDQFTAWKSKADSSLALNLGIQTALTGLAPSPSAAHDVVLQEAAVPAIRWLSALDQLEQRDASKNDNPVEAAAVDLLLATY